MILVTGANSLLGTNVVLELMKQGFEVCSLVRHSNKVLDSTHVIYGNVASEEDLRRAMVGCTAVVHIAAITAQNLTRLDDYRFNWECAASVARVAAQMGLDRMVFVSSSNTIGNGTVNAAATESEPLQKPYLDSLYAQSKIRAESEVLTIFPRTIIINPAFMLGAYDSKPSSGEIITRVRRRHLVFAPPGGKSFVHVRDVACAIVSALSRGRFGERYLASGHSMSIREFYTLLQGVTARRFAMVTPPSFVLIGFGYLGDLLRKCGIRIPVSSANMGILCRKEYYDNSKAVRELGMPQSSVEQAVGDAVAWFSHQSAEKKS